MIPFKTSPDQLVQLATFVTRMSSANLPTFFVATAFKLAEVDQGVFDLVALWAESDDEEERAEIVADIQDAIDEVEELPKQPVEKPYIRFDKLDAVAAAVHEHKKRLRKLIDKHGGVSAVARKSGIPQPSLSRMLNSDSMPRRTTLYRLANALGVAEAEVIGEWIR